MLVVKGRHPIETDPNGAQLDIELGTLGEPPEAESPDHKKRRFEAMGAQDVEAKLYGKGVDFTVREKRFLLELKKNCTAYWERDNCEYLNVRGENAIWWRPRPTDVGNFFEEITGVSRKTAERIQKDADKDDDGA